MTALNIFNVKNRTLKEMYVGTSEMPIEGLRDRHLQSPPPQIKHWDFRRHDIFYEEVQKGVPEGETGFFFQNYALLTGLPGWKTIMEDKK